MSKLFILVAFVAVGCVNARSLQQSNAVRELDTTLNVLIRCGDVRKDPVTGKDIKLGTVIDKMGRPILDSNGTSRTSNNPDFTSYLKTPDNRLFSVVQMEDAPAGYFALGLEQREDGHLRVNTITPINISQWDGSIRPCAGSVSPWGTHIGGEESWPDVKSFTALLKNGSASCNMADTACKAAKAKAIDDVVKSSDVRNILNWQGFYFDNKFGYTNFANDTAGRAQWFEKFKTAYKPYMIGHIIEINVNSPAPTFEKHLALGRSSFESALIMPDRRTVYLTDDATSGGLLMFVMDKKDDLSKGTLYGAKFIQTSPNNVTGATFNIEWKRMASLDHDTLLAAARMPLTDMNFDKIFVQGKLVGAGCEPGFTRIDWQESECLKLVDNSDYVRMLAAGLETRRFIPFVGATSEFSKMEGITFDEKRAKLYMAISYQRANMVPGKPSTGQDDVRVAANRCGCTYALDVNNKYEAVNMKEQVCGVETLKPEDKEPSCSLDVPQNPDNLDMMKGFPWLLISEDAGRNQPLNNSQDLLWMHNVDTKQNILVGAAEGGGAEVTAGLVTEIQTKKNKYTYITVNYQGGDPNTLYPAPICYLGPYELTGTKNVTWKAHVPKGPEFKNPYGPFAV